jgi:short-subunit dehydrogenase
MGKTRLSRLPGMAPARVADIGWRGFVAGKRVVIPGFLNKMTAFFGPRVPRAAVLAMAAYLASHRRDT